MKYLAFVVPVAVLVASSAFADPITDRQDIMKERGSLMRILGPVAQGQQPFDAAIVNDALEKLSANAALATNVETYWPEGSQTGDTKSAPSIWEDMAGYQAASDKFAADAAAADAADPQDLASFQAVFGPAAANCGACHEVYRLR